MSFNLISISLIAVALAMDAFSVSLTKGFTQKYLTKSQILFYGLFFGGFQALMPIFGYFCGNVIANIVKSIAPILGFVLLLLIGLNMIRESLTGDDDCRYIFRQKAWKLLRRQIPDSWWSNPYTFRI